MCGSVDRHIGQPGPLDPAVQAMQKTKALCVFTTLLGHKPEVSRFTAALNRLQQLECTYVLIDSDDYLNYRPPRWARRTGPWEFEFVARRKARSVLEEEFDILLVNVWEFAIAFAEMAKSCPAAALIDCTPASISTQVRQRGLGGWQRRLAHQAHHLAFGRVAERFDFYLAKGSDCADSLYSDYKIPRERCFVTLNPQPLDSWIPAARTRTPPARLLFVGNDFRRKGGNFLLEIYRRHLAGDCILTIVSNDPLLNQERLPEGVTWLKGRNRDELLGIFQASDVFVFPSQQDFVPEALAEALAVGLPCIVRDIPGVRDLVQPGENGLRMARDAPIEAWAAELRRLIANPAELSRMSTNARRFAEEKLSFEPFAQLVNDVVERLCSLRATKAFHRT